MIYKCPNCNGALEYNPSTDKMQCFHCGNDFFLNELDENRVEIRENILSQEELEEEKRLDFTKNRTIYDEPEFMECKIYTCSSCGAELTVGDADVSTYCAYCGQPTILYNRLDKAQKPKYILPFKVSKEEAKNIISQKLRKGHFIPSEFRKIEAERISGIYIPYFLYDVYYHHKTRVKHGDNYTLVEADCEFVQLCQEASKSLDNELAYALEPYDLKELKEFEPGYLSGFNAERFDLSRRQLVQTVGRRCKQLFDNELERRCNAAIVRLDGTTPFYEIRKADYAFLPVWFMTFRYQDKPYTLMVNGQTGNIVGAVPIHQSKVVWFSIFMATILSVLLGVFGCVIFGLFGKESFVSGLLLFAYIDAFVFGIIMLITSILKYKKVKRNIKLTRLNKRELS